MQTKLNERPLSPHLQIYRLPFPAILSVLHRATGILLVLGMLLLTYWLGALAAGEAAFKVASAVLGSWLGQTVLFAWTWAWCYHLANGVRHLVWDAGYGLELPSVYRSGWVAVGMAFALTGLLWWLA